MSLVLILEASFPYWRMLICTARSLCLLHSCRQSDTSSSSLSSSFFLSSSELLSNMRIIEKISCMFWGVSTDLQIFDCLRVLLSVTCTVLFIYQGPELQCLPKVKEDLSKVLIFQDAKNNVSN